MVAFCEAGDVVVKVFDSASTDLMAVMHAKHLFWDADSVSMTRDRRNDEGLVEG